MSARAFPAVSALVVALAVSSFGLVPTQAAAPSSTDRTSPSATKRIVMRPVTTAGTPAPGVLVANDPQRITVDCSSRDPSPGAVSHDIEFCSPSAAYAVACWKAATPHHVLCSRNPSSGRVYSLSRNGTFATAGLAARRNRAPLMLVLGNGNTCLIRDGGAWSTLNAHPRWYGTYSCGGHAAVWSPPNAPHSGINESSPTWIVHVAPISGNGKVVVRSVRKAYFVGTHS